MSVLQFSLILVVYMYELSVYKEETKKAPDYTPGWTNGFFFSKFPSFSKFFFPRKTVLKQSCFGQLNSKLPPDVSVKVNGDCPVMDW